MFPLETTTSTTAAKFTLYKIVIKGDMPSTKTALCQKHFSPALE